MHGLDQFKCIGGIHFRNHLHVAWVSLWQRELFLRLQWDAFRN